MHANEQARPSTPARWKCQMVSAEVKCSWCHGLTSALKSHDSQLKVFFALVTSKTEQAARLGTDYIIDLSK